VLSAEDDGDDDYDDDDNYDDDDDDDDDDNKCNPTSWFLSTAPRAFCRLLPSHVTPLCNITIAINIHHVQSKPHFQVPVKRAEILSRDCFKNLREK